MQDGSYTVKKRASNNSIHHQLHYFHDIENISRCIFISVYGLLARQKIEYDIPGPTERPKQKSKEGQKERKIY